MDYFEKFSGVCVEDTCTRARPGPDGGIIEYEYDCLECVRDDKPGGTGGKGGEGASGGTGGKGGAGGSKAAADSVSSDSGCAAASGSGGVSNSMLLGAGLSLLFLKRRRARA